MLTLREMILAAAVLTLCGPVIARAHGTGCQLTLVQAQTLVIDPACITCGQGLVEILLRNDNSNPVQLHLSIGQLATSDSHKLVWSISKVVATEPHESNGDFLRQLQPGQFVTVTIKINGLVENGEWEEHLFNWGTDLGKFSVIRSHRTFAISFDAQDPDHAQFDTEQGSRIEIPIKNPDTVDYTVEWTLDVQGAKTASVTKVLPSGRTDVISLSLPDGFLRLGWLEWLEYTLKGKTVDANLLASLKPEDRSLASGAPAKILPFKIRLLYSPEANRNWMRALLILFILVSGAFVSLFLNAFLPNQSKRRDLKSRLKSLETDIRALPMELSSTLRVLVGVERRRLSEGLNAMWSTDSDFSRLADDTSAAIDRLQKRVKCIQQLGDLRIQFAPCDQILVPTLLDQTEARFNDAINVLSQDPFGDVEVASFQAILKKIQDLLLRLEAIKTEGQTDDALVADLRERMLWLRAAIGDDPATNTNYSGYIATLGSLFDQLRAFNPDHILPGDYVRFDQVLYKVALLQGIISAKTLLRTSMAAAKLQAQENLIISDLQQTSWTSIERASLRVKEMQEGIFKEDIIQAIIENPVSIDSPFGSSPKDERFQSRVGRFLITLLTEFYRALRKQKSRPAIPSSPNWRKSRGVLVDTSASEPRTFQAIRLKIRLTNESLNCAAARHELVPVWDFGDQTLTPERGWSVTHYFPLQAVYTVRISFEDRGNGPVTLPGGTDLVFAGQQFTVGPTNDRGTFLKAGAKLAIAQLGIALIPVILALYSGASEQLAKLDVIPGIIAVFLLGFSSDQVKNLLTR